METEAERDKAFVILAHSGHGPPHYDLMLRGGQGLATWRVAVNPADLTEGQATEAEPLSDHRLVYLTYEGPVSGDRGHVRRIAEGTYRSLVHAADRWQVALQAEAMGGCFELTRREGEPPRWLLTRISRR